MPLSPAAIADCADFIADLRQRRNGQRPPIDSIPAAFRPETLEDAYTVQEAARPLIATRGRGEPVGWKIGSTSPPMQAALGIPFPCGGTLYAGTVHQRHAAMQRADYSKPGLECEIAVRLSADLPVRSGGYDRDSVLPAVAAVMTSVELVEWRFVDFKRAGVPSLVADDFFSCGCVLGAEHPASVLAGDANIAGRFTVDGKFAATGNAWNLAPWMVGPVNEGLEALACVDGEFRAGLQLDGTIFRFALQPGGVVQFLGSLPSHLGRTDLAGLDWDPCTGVVYALHDTADVLVEYDAAGAFLREYAAAGSNQEGVALRHGSPDGTTSVAPTA